MKTQTTKHELCESGPAGERDPRNLRFTVDGKRVSREAFDEIKRDPRVRLDTFYTTRNGGNVSHYCTATQEVSP